LFHPTAKVEERKLQILDEGLDSIEIGNKSISFFNKIATEKKNYAQESRFNP
jgi:hypothetical protein